VAMERILPILRKTPPAVLIFCSLHVVVSLYLLWALFAMRCVDDPCPPGAQCLDGCSLLYDPWREGHAVYLLSPILLLILSTLWLLRASRLARIGLIVSIVWFVVASHVYIAATLVSRHVGASTPYGWSEAWSELLSYTTVPTWAVIVGWLAIDVWFLFGSQARHHFRVAT
jgi:hypothetical protein